LLPLIVVGAIPVLDLGRGRISGRWRSALARTATVALAVAMVALSLVEAMPEVRRNRRIESDRKLIGLYLRDHAPHARIAVAAAGAIPYYSGLKALDILGLNDTHIAHTAAHTGAGVTAQKFDPRYVVRSQPDIVPLDDDSLTADATTPDKASLLAKYATLRHSHYSVYSALLVSSSPSYDAVSLEVVPGRWLHALVRHGFVIT
jgi:hypothetical protein